MNVAGCLANLHRFRVGILASSRSPFIELASPSKEVATAAHTAGKDRYPADIPAPAGKICGDVRLTLYIC